MDVEEGDRFQSASSSGNPPAALACRAGLLRLAASGVDREAWLGLGFRVRAGAGVRVRVRVRVSLGCLLTYLTDEHALGGAAVTPRTANLLVVLLDLVRVRVRVRVRGRIRARARARVRVRG